MTRSLRARITATAALAAAVALLVVGGTTATLTEAAWVDREHSRRTFAAVTVPKPATTNCSYASVLGLGGSVTINFTLPLNTGYAGANFQYGYVDGTGTTLWVTTGTTITTTGNSATGVYQTVVSNGLLAGALGGGVTIVYRIVDNGWIGPISSVRATSAALGINPQCVVVS